VFYARSHGYLVLEQEPPPSAFGTFPRCAGEGTAKSCNFESFQLARFGQVASFGQVAPLGQGASLAQGAALGISFLRAAGEGAEGGWGRIRGKAHQQL
jgi:hypothetical protein